MNEKDDVVYFVLLKTKNDTEIEDMTACMTLKEAIKHGMHLVKKYGNINITMLEVEEYDEASYENGVRSIIYKKEIE